MIMHAGVYAMYSNTPWVDPVNPKPNIISPALICKNECCQAEWQHLNVQENFHQMMVIKTTIKPMCWAGIWDTVLYLTCFCILTIFHWLFHTYGWIHPQEIADNKLKIMYPWDQNIPFGMLVERFCKYQQFTTNGNNSFT